MNRTFINLYIDGKIPRNLLLKHLLFITIWVLFFLLVVFRTDSYLLGGNYSRFSKAIPELYFIAVVLVMTRLKWYSNLALLFYPILQVFWFTPKFILQMGKIYLLWSYLNFIWNCLKKYKTSAIYGSVFLISLLFLFIADNTIAKIIAMLTMIFFYFKLAYRHIKEAFTPTTLFGEKLDSWFKELNQKSSQSSFFIDSVENRKDNAKLTEEQNRNKKLESLIICHSIMEYFRINFGGLRGTLAFYKYWGYRFISFFLITIALFSFINHELFSINPNNFSLVASPSKFNFICYTIKSFALSGEDYFRPISTLAHVTEIATFLFFVIFIMFFIVSFFRSLMLEKVKHSTNTAIQVIVLENSRIEQHIQTKYKTSISEVVKNVDTIKKAVADIKRVIESLF